MQVWHNKEEKIKRDLHEESYANPQYDFRKSYFFHKSPRQNESFRQLSDWSNDKIIETVSLPKIQVNQQKISTRFQNIDLASYRSQLLRNRNQVQQTNSIASSLSIKFDIRRGSLASTLRRSFMSFQKNSHGQITRTKKSPKFKINNEYYGQKQSKSPRYDRYPGNYRILKKINREHKKKRFQNYFQPQNVELVSIKLH